MLRFWWTIPGRRRGQMVIACVLLAVAIGLMGSERHQKFIMTAGGVDGTGAAYDGRGAVTEWSWFEIPWLVHAEASWTARAAGTARVGAVTFPVMSLGGSSSLLSSTQDGPRLRRQRLEETLAAAGSSPTLMQTDTRVVWTGLVVRTCVPVLIACALVLVFALLYVQGLGAKGATRCASCDYPLVPRTDGQPGDYCPECGGRFR